MSETYDIACHDCGIVLWIGQAPTSSETERGRIYYGSGDSKGLLSKFLYEHIGHRLEFNMSQHFDALHDYQEVDRDTGIIMDPLDTLQG
jgi:hypothetical protein